MQKSKPHFPQNRDTDSIVEQVELEQMDDFAKETLEAFRLRQQELAKKS